MAGCVGGEVCEKIERMLGNVVRMMFVRWDVPSWKEFDSSGKIAKYLLWIKMMSSSEIMVKEQSLIFNT